MIRHFLNVSLLAVVVLLSFDSSHLGADIISTGFAGGNGQAGNMFDVNILAPTGVEISELEVNLTAGTWDIQLFTKPGSYAGSETTPGDWTLHETFTGLTSTAANTPTAWDISDLTLAAGGHAFYVNVQNGAALNYTNGTSEGSLVASNADIQIFEGTGNVADFGPQFRPRVWNGSIIYETVSTAVIPEPNSLLAMAGVLLTLASVRRKRI